MPNETCVVTLTDRCVSNDASSMFFPDHHTYLPHCYQVNSFKDVHGDVNELRKGISLQDFGIEEGFPIIACIVRQSRCNFETMCMYMELLTMLPTAIFLIFEQTSSLLQRYEVWRLPMPMVLSVLGSNFRIVCPLRICVSDYCFGCESCSYCVCFHW